MLDAFDPRLPLEKARTIPSSWYTNPTVYDEERRRIFGNTWQAVARREQLKHPQCFVTTDLAGEPILLVRAEDGVLRAFYNVCRHRAARVQCGEEGTTTRLRCRYHGWTYDLTGRLRGTPEFDGVEEFAREDNGLVPLTVAEWGPLVWVHADRPKLSLADYLTPLPKYKETFQFGSLHFAARREYQLACNWKVFVDNYLDGGYHINTVHPGLAGILDYSRYRTEIHPQTSVQISPLCATDKPVSEEVGKVRTGENAYYWWIFPNLMINVYDGVMDTNMVLPIDAEHCKVIFDFYFGDVASPSARAFNEKSIEVAHQIQLEDQHICEEVQRGLRSRSFNVGRFSVRREAPGYHFHRLLAEWLGHQD